MMTEAQHLEPSELTALHRLSSNHRDRLERDGGGHCFHCMATVSLDGIVEWADDGRTGVCPFCSVDALLAARDVALVPRMTPWELMSSMHSYWFGRFSSRTVGEPLTLQAVQVRAWRTAAEKGFWDHRSDGTSPSVGEKLMLTVCELAEAMEEVRTLPVEELRRVRRDDDGKPDGFPVELADAVIRICDLAHMLGVDLTSAVREKLDFNEGRPHLHGKLL